jgi:Na+-driven multidrug efflux pump
MDMKRYNKDMLNGPLLGSIISYTVPIILASVLQLLFNAADLVVVGRFRGSLSVGAVGATGAISNLIINLFIGLSVGVGVNVARAIGSRDAAATKRMVHTALPVALIGGVVLTIVGVLFAEPLLVLMGTPRDILPLSTTYMQIYFAGMTFTMVYNYCAAILRAAGDTQSPLIFLVLAGILNVLLNLL